MVPDVDYRFASAHDGPAYAARTIAAGQRTAAAEVRIVHDGKPEFDETFQAYASVYFPADDEVRTTPSVLLTIPEHVDADARTTPDARAPAGLTVEPGDGQLTVRWTKLAPLPAAVLRYEVQHRLESAPGWSAPASVARDAASHTVTGLDNGSSYRVRVRIVTGTAGAPSYSHWVSAAGAPVGPVVTPPAAPADLTVTPGDGELALAWTAPSGTVTGYDAHYTSADTGTVADGAAASGADPAAAWVAADRTEADPPAASQTISGLDNGIEYRVRVRAKNAAGAGAWALDTGTPAAPVPPPAPPPPPPPSPDASLSALALSAGSLDFAPRTTAYAVRVPGAVASVTVTPTASHPGATVTVNGVEVESGEASDAIPLAVGETVIEVVVTAPGGASGTYRVTVTRAPGEEAAAAEVAFFPAAASNALQGFVRVVNASDEAGTVRIRAFDDAGDEYGPVTLAIGAGAVRHFNSGDLERGNPAKGLTGATGAPETGHWRLAFESALGLRVMGYLRTADGFVTAMHETVAETASEDGYRYEVVFFNPASNTNQVSRLRLVSRSDAEAAVTITGRDDAGRAGEESVRLTLPAGAARMLRASDLESGGEGLEGALGDGRGKWRLRVRSDRPLAVMSLLASPTGHLTNLSTAPPASRGRAR